MDDLSSEILNADRISEVETILQKAFEDIEFVGELDVDEETFAKIGELLRHGCRFAGRIQKRYLRPATFVTSLVFSARYSNTESRNFWHPYARDVWGLDATPSFQTLCRNYFSSARWELTERFGLEFPVFRWGDVVRPVYWHAIIPAYVQDDFARWFARNLRRISGLSGQELSDFLKERNTDALDVRPLQTFLDNKNTHEIALAIISSLVAATELLAEQQDPADIRALFSSQIRRELWDEYIRRLDTRPVATVSRRRHVRLEWVWSFEEEDWILRLLNLVTASYSKPQLCIWAQSSADQALQDWDNRRFDIWPEQLPNGQWRVREISMNVPDQVDMLNGNIYVYDDGNYCIFQQAIPPLPAGEFQFYRITPQDSYAVSVKAEQLTSGEILVSYRNDLQLLDAANQRLVPLQTDYYVSDIMENRVGHQHIARYALDLPLTIKTEADEIRVEQTRRRIASPKLSDEHRIPNTSKRVPPVYTSNCIHAHFPEVPAVIRALKIHVITPARQYYVPFDTYAEPTEDGYQLDLSQLIPADRIGTYAIDITYDFRSRLASPIEVSVVPHLRFSDPGDDTFHPLNLPRIRVDNIRTETVESPDEATHVEALSNGEQLVTWTDLRTSYCRLHIHQDDRVVPIEWPIQRIYAWFEGTALSTTLLASELDKAKIHFRGRRKAWLHLYIGDHRQPVTLDARGERAIDLRTDQLGVILVDQKSSKVPLRLGLDGREWIIGTFVRKPQIVSFEAEYVHDHDAEAVLISMAFSESLGSELLIKIINLPDCDEIARTASTDQENLFLLDCQLSDGKYRICVFADGEELQLPGPGEFIVKPPSVDIEANHQGNRLSVKYELDNLRLGNYSLAVFDAHGNTIFRETLDPTDDRFEANVDLLPRAQYMLNIFWNGQSLRASPLPFVTRTRSGIAHYDSVLSPSTSALQEHSPSDLISYLIKQRPEAFAGETLFRLATLQPQMMQQYSLEQLEGCWRPLAQISKAHRNTFEPLPTWALAKNALLVETKRNNIFWVYPERIAWRGLAGIGKIKIKTPQEGEIFAYARWSRKGTYTSRLRIWIPSQVPANEIFSDLDELDMWPAYYERLSGTFHGMRTKAMTPGLNRANDTYLVDCAHDYTLVVQHRRTDRALKHVYSPAVSIDRKYTQALLRQRSVGQRNSGHVPDITSAAGYRWVTAAWYRGFVDDDRQRIHLRALADTRNTAGKLSNFEGVMPWILRKYDEPLFSGGLRFLKGMEAQAPTEDGDHMMQLDRHMLALGIILRSYSLKRQSARLEILNRINMTEDQLKTLLERANRTCPDLLEWALTWSEIFIVHSSA